MDIIGKYNQNLVFIVCLFRDNLSMIIMINILHSVKTMEASFYITSLFSFVDYLFTYIAEFYVNAL